MKRKAVTLAVAGALGVPVAAFAQNVQIYGKLYPELVYAKTTGATVNQADASSTLAPKVGPDAKPRLSQDQGNSYLGFRGSEDLGSGLKAIWQIESAVVLDTGDKAFLAARDSFVGLTGGFGTIRLGNMDTVWKRIGDPMSILGISSGNIQSSSNILAKAGFNSGASSFNLRQPNSFAYESPTFGGVQLLAQYSPDESKDSLVGATGTPSTTQKNAWLASYGVKYEAGGLYLALAQELHNDFFTGSTGTFNSATIASPNASLGTTVHSRDTGTRASASYEFGNTKIGGDVARFDYKETGGATGTFADYKHNAWLVGVQQKFGNLTAAVNYGKSDAGSCSLNGGVGCSATGLDGNLITGGLGLSYSKRTMIFALAARLNNGNSAVYKNTANFSPNPGADSTQFAMGVSHSF